MTYGINLFEDAPFELLVCRNKIAILEDFIMGSMMPAPLELEDGSQTTLDDLIEVNLGTGDEFRLTFISARFSLEE